MSIRRLLFLWIAAAGLCLPPPAAAEQLADAHALYKQGHYKEAFSLYDRLLKQPIAEQAEGSTALENAVRCLERLGRVSEFDPFMERVLKAQAGRWRLLAEGARLYRRIIHNGMLISGEFTRGYSVGKGEPVSAEARDRTRSIQLVLQALKTADQASPGERSELYFELARSLEFGASGARLWRLYGLTDLETLPDYSEHRYGHRFGGTSHAAVDESGSPLYFSLPETFDDAANDGERRRWALAKVYEIAPDRRSEVLIYRADFLQQIFGVQTLGSYLHSPIFLAGEQDSNIEQSVFALHTLSEQETIARLASGVRRFELPPEHNFIALYLNAADIDSPDAAAAFDKLAGIFQNRRQFPRAAQMWRRALKRQWTQVRQSSLDQIVGAWGQFEQLGAQPAGAPASVTLRFRNAQSVRLTSRKIDLARLVDDVQQYLSSNPQRIDWRKVNLNGIGRRILYENGQKYLSDKAAEWTVSLDPPEDHLDSYKTIETPIDEAGAYLLSGTVAGGNTFSIVVWIEEIAFVEKPIDKGRLYFLADAGTGRPLPGAELELFGYRSTERTPRGRLQRSVETKRLALRADEQGLVEVSETQAPRNYSWMMTIQYKGETFYRPFFSIWYPSYHRAEFQHARMFGVTNQPVYRPGQTVRYALWARLARYDAEERGKYAGKYFTVVLNSPKGEELEIRKARADDYGGIHGEFELPQNTDLGVYSIWIRELPGSSADFRVEEYKKPEFEVIVDAPEEPASLGEPIRAVIRADYYHGAPVSRGTVEYRVMRTAVRPDWFPSDPWDMLYGSGYWWFCDEHPWYPGWKHWGYRSPAPPWLPQQMDPPELVLEGKGALLENGTFELQIDTALAKALHGDASHRYEITATVTDASRRAISGTGSVIASNGKLLLRTWVGRGYYRPGDAVQARVSARSASGAPQQVSGELTLYAVSYDQNGRPNEEALATAELSTNQEGLAEHRFRPPGAGQYRLEFRTRAESPQVSGYLFNVFGEHSNPEDFRFNALELLVEQRSYAPGERVRLRVNSERAGAAILLFVRPENGVYQKPSLLQLDGKSGVVELTVSKSDMPNFFVEAVAVSSAEILTEVREVFVPPAERRLDVELIAGTERLKPGGTTELTLRLTGEDGEPFVGSTVLAAYDKALEYISGGHTTPNIFTYFWDWRRRHHTRTGAVSIRHEQPFFPPGEQTMRYLGVFGRIIGGEQKGGPPGESSQIAPAALAEERSADMLVADAPLENSLPRQRAAAPAAAAPAAIRRDFADSALWQAGVETNKQGIVKVKFTVPDNLTTWKIRGWAVGRGTRVGEAQTEIITAKNLLMRLQAPRFFVEGDEVILSANVHNYLSADVDVRARLELEGGALEAVDSAKQRAQVAADGETRFDWRVRAVKEGNAVIRMFALSPEESDAVEMSFPVFVHGMEKVETFSTMVPSDGSRGSFTFSVPEKRRPEETRFELRYSPSLALSMIDALPYLVSYPYGCTEQTLSRFLPTILVRRMLLDLDIALPDLKRDLSRLNSQLREPAARRWKEYAENPVFSEEQAREMALAGLERLESMQMPDGGWGWFSGGGRSGAHTTAYVVHGLLLARQQDLPVDSTVLERGIAWLVQYQAAELRKLTNAETSTKPFKNHADNTDAFVNLVLGEAGRADSGMRNLLFRDRLHLAVYSQAMLGLSLHRDGRSGELDTVLRNIEQYLVHDEENQTSYLQLPNHGYWWMWYGSTFEAHAYYLKLLTRTAANPKAAGGIAKYLVNNRRRKHYWTSTRDTAVVIEALTEYARASGETAPEMTVEVLVDGRTRKEVQITKDSLFEYDNELLLAGRELSTGEHRVELRKNGRGTLYSSAYLSTFTLEDFIERAGLEVKVRRSIYRLKRRTAAVNAGNQFGGSTSQEILAYDRVPLQSGAQAESGDLVEIELEIETKNDYEYLVFEDMKAAGFEPVEVQSGYNGNSLGAYVEYRDNRVVFFVDSLPRGRHSVSYRMRAEVPGSYSALPTRASAMYAPEIRANSNEFKVSIGEQNQ